MTTNPKSFHWWEVLLMVMGVAIIVWLERIL